VIIEVCKTEIRKVVNALNGKKSTPKESLKKQEQVLSITTVETLTTKKVVCGASTVKGLMNGIIVKSLSIKILNFNVL